MKTIATIYTPAIISRLKKQSGFEGFAHTLSSDDEAAQLYRRELEKWLGTGLELGIINRDRIARLTGRDFDQCLQTVQELMALYYFRDVLRFNVRPDPNGDGTHVGEFEICDQGLPKPVFCEVKTPIRATPTGGIWSGNDAEAIKKVLKSAYAQVPKDDRPSIVILTAKLRSPVSSQFSGIVEAV